MRVALAVSGVGASAAALALIRSLRRGSWLRRHRAAALLAGRGDSAPRPHRRAFAGLRTDPDIVVDLERSLRAQVEPALAGTEGSGAITYAIEPAWGEPAERILDAASAHGCDLLVMGAESHHGLARIAHPAVASGVAHKASRISVVFVPPAPAMPCLGARAGRSPPCWRRRTCRPPGIARSRSPTRCSRLTAASSSSATSTNARCPRPRTPTTGRTARSARPSAPAWRASCARWCRATRTRMGITTHVSVIDGAHAADAIVQRRGAPGRRRHRARVSWAERGGARADGLGLAGGGAPCAPAGAGGAELEERSLLTLPLALAAPRRAIVTES